MGSITPMHLKQRILMIKRPMTEPHAESTVNLRVIQANLEASSKQTKKKKAAERLCTLSSTELTMESNAKTVVPKEVRVRY